MARKRNKKSKKIQPQKKNEFLEMFREKINQFLDNPEEQDRIKKLIEEAEKVNTEKENEVSEIK